MTHPLHPFTISIKPISIETIKLEMHSQAITAEGVCTCCGYKYSPSNIFSRTGWEETKRTGVCQICTQEQSVIEDEDSDSYITT